MSDFERLRQEAERRLRQINENVQNEIDSLRLDYPELLIAGGVSWDIQER